MSNRPRPLLLGYIRASALRGTAEVAAAQQALEAFATRESFSLGPVFTESEGASDAFHAMVEELGRNDAARGVVIPDRRHLSCDEQLFLSRHEQGAQTPVLVVGFAPLAGGPGALSPVCTGSAHLSDPPVSDERLRRHAD